MKKDPKERKAGGALLSGAPGAAGGVRLAGAKAASGLAAVLTSKAGLAVLVLGVGAAGLVGYGVLKGKSGGSNATAAKPKLFGMETSLHVRRPAVNASNSLNFASEATKGELRWDGGTAVPKAEGKPSADDPAAAKAEDGKDADAPSDKAVEEKGVEEQIAAAQRMSNDFAGAKLSQGSSNSFGSRSIFGSGGGMKQLQGMGGGNMLAKGNLGRTPLGKMSSLGRKRTPVTAQKMTAKGVTAKRAMGQLKFANAQSRQGAAAGAHETGANYAAAAFEQGKTQGGELSGPNFDGAGTVNPMGGGTPSAPTTPTSPAVECPSGYTPVDGGGCQPPDVAGTNVTPYQPMVNSAQTMTTMALIFAVLGLALLAIGYANTPWPWAYVLIGIGIALLAVALMLALMAQQMGGNIGSQYGQPEQENVIDQHSTSAADGKQSAYQGQLGESKDIHQTTQEESKSTYEDAK
ncbi:MAG: hypothetical protein HY922_13340 [Elusimicrobia bacterium]|nr:hypothetical protein [Elusimicrobiota bacterium]